MHERRSCPPATALLMLLLPWSVATTPSGVRSAVCRLTRSTHTPLGGFAAFLRPLSSRSRSIRQSDVPSSGKRRGRKSKPLIVMQLDPSRSVQPQILRDFGAPGGDGGGPGALGGLTGPSNGGEGDNDRVVPVELKTELSSSFMQYAMSTILGRALPDARDGLKPVHRRILYAMHVLGLNPEGGYRKCARVVGEVLGKYHPHGDMSVYDALVRMAQDFVMSAPLISGHGNFGSVDNDPAAAMRYTECKLSSLARDALLADISMDTVGFVPNFDGNEVEPLVLPARVPMLFLNGAAGIAVGMATNVPPHNLGELIDGLVALIDNREVSDEELMQLIPAPDFPTGGHIMGLDGAKKLYSTGMGGVVIRAKTHMETVSIGGGRQARNAIIVTELPYQVNKAALLEKIADLVNDKKLDGIADLRDESDRDGIRVVIELKRDAVPTVVENNLFKKTQLQVSFPGNLLALSSDGKQPQRLTLRAGLQTFIGFRFQTIRKRTQFELSRVEAREHIVEGLIAALDRIDDIVELVRKAKDTAAARNVLMSAEYGMSEAQTGAILSLTLGRLTALEDKKLRSERDELQGKRKVLRSLMVEDDKVYSVMKKELREIRQKHAVPRRSIITSSAAELTDMDLLANDRSVVMVTSNGYIKRMPLVEFEQQGRGTRGKAGAGRMGEDDLVMHFFACNDHDHVVFISEKGVAFAVHAFQVPLGSRTAKGVPLPQVLPLSSDDHVSSVIPLGEPIREDEYLMFLTKRGSIKKTSVAAFAKPLTSRGLIAISLEDGDALQWARRCTDADDVLISTRHGYSMRFKAADLRPTGRTSKGCRAIKLREGDEMVDIDILSPSTKGKKYVLAITTNGYGKRIPANSFRALSRGTKGVIAIKFKAGLDDSLACMRSCAEDDEVVLTTQRGTIVRQRVEDISVQSRMGTGVTVQRLEEGNHVVSVAMVKAEQNEEEDSASTKKKKPASLPAAAEELLVADG